VATDWSAVEALATSFGVLGALGYNGWALRDTRRRSAAAAERAESAAGLAIDNNERLVKAIKAISLQAGAAPEDKQVRWSLAHERGAIYRLVNLGGATALKVDVCAHPTMARFELRDGDRYAVRQDDALTFFAVPAWQTVDRTITVTWQDSEDTAAADRSAWKYPLPAKKGEGGE
jgi:hypothetical protein